MGDHFGGNLYVLKLRTGDVKLFEQWRFLENDAWRRWFMQGDRWRNKDNKVCMGRLAKCNAFKK